MKFMQFNELPRDCALAIARYMLDVGMWKKPKNWDVWMAERPFRSKDQEIRCLKKALPMFRQYYGWKLFGFYEASTKEICETVAKSYNTDFNTYQEGYLDQNEVPNYGRIRWPLIFNAEGDVLLDGHRRLNFYHLKNVRKIKCVFPVKRDSSPQQEENSEVMTSEPC